MVLPLLIAIGAVIIGMAVFHLVLLNWSRIKDWFSQRQALALSNKNNVAFTLQERLKNGNYSTVQGIFNQKTNTLLDGQKYESEEIGKKLAKRHRNESLVLYS